ncbi:MAG: tRNA (adenosine(37)-N6)-threonylcarbamoyltransferase complex transferase subunit TsaD [Thermoleophilia bacterium]
MILGIETSCDETAAAVITDGGEVLSSVIASQSEVHARYGGVVPEVASRRHLEQIGHVIGEALTGSGVELDGISRLGVTRGPGLIGALLVGLSAAKAIAWARGLPLVAVDHLQGHVASLYLGPTQIEPPFACLLATGGHTQVLEVRERGSFERLGTTLDDAAGEAFDKGARLLGLPYPGGAEIDALAQAGDPEAFSFPVARVPGLDFSFSGVKTSLLYTVRSLGEEAVAERRADLAASYQRAIVTALTRRLHQAAESRGLSRIAIVGGVAANSELRAALPEASVAPLSLCTDNAAMIASAARYAAPLSSAEALTVDAYASAS